jgi:hypothetical protein
VDSDEHISMSKSHEWAGWPELRLAEWQDTRDTLHLWTQIVGKVRLALAPWTNHWWHVPLYVNSVGLTTSLMPHGSAGVEIVFDFSSHELIIQTTRGARRRLRLEPRTVADFYAEFRTCLDELGIGVQINPRPVELDVAIPFPEDTEHASYDPDAAHRFWTSLVSAHRVMSQFRGQFRGKASPVHFFWGGFDLATSRFSGRTAPTHPGGIPNCPDWVMTEAYNAEVSSCGYWPGGAPEGIFYSYAYPEPSAFASSPIHPEEARYDRGLREFVLPYSAVRTAPDPAAELLAFLTSTHDAAATTGNWPLDSTATPVGHRADR